MTQPPDAPQVTPTCYRHPGRETWIRCQRCDKPICPDCMIPASVGHQCPSCVKEGAKQTRSGRTAYGGTRPADSRLTTFLLMGLNLAVWLAVVSTGAQDGTLFRKLALLPRETFFRLEDGTIQLFEGVSGGAWWQVLTMNITHYSVLHIAMNMLFLYLIGPIVEAPIGRARLLAGCLVTGLTSSAAVMLLADPISTTMGFSGIALGLLGMYVVFALKVGGDRSVLLQLVGFQVLFNLLARDLVSWQGHLGGFVGGLLVGAVLAYAPRQHRTSIQAAGLALIGLVAVVLIVVRALALA